jgi:hypothetical protein
MIEITEHPRAIGWRKAADHFEEQAGW